MDKKLLSKNILKKTKEYALLEYMDLAFDAKRPDYFMAKCYAHGYIGALISEGYKVTIEKDKKKYNYPVEK